MLFLKHSLRLIRDLFGYCWTNDVWWPIPLMTLLLLGALLAVGSQVVAPYIYTLF